MGIDKLDILCRAICAFGDLTVCVENITPWPDEVRLRVDWCGTPFLLYYRWRNLPVKYNGLPGSERCQAHERFERLMKQVEDHGGHGIVVDFLLRWNASQRREFIACADEALKILLNYCPYHSHDGKCPEDCAQWHAGICGVIRKATINYSFWLSEEHKDKKDENY